MMWGPDDDAYAKRLAVQDGYYQHPRDAIKDLPSTRFLDPERVQMSEIPPGVHMVDGIKDGRPVNPRPQAEEPQLKDGQYLVVVELNDMAKLEWEGYAQNVTDALYKALAKHEESLEDECE